MPQSRARDGAGQLLDTLTAYYASGLVAAQAARKHWDITLRAVIDEGDDGLAFIADGFVLAGRMPPVRSR